jgi:hypothetical protein
MKFRIWLRSASRRVTKMLILETSRYAVHYEILSDYTMLCTVIATYLHYDRKDDIQRWGWNGFEFSLRHQPFIPSAVRDMKRRLSLIKSCHLIRDDIQHSEDWVRMKTNYPFPFYFEHVFNSFHPQRKFYITLFDHITNTFQFPKKGVVHLLRLFRHKKDFLFLFFFFSI